MVDGMSDDLLVIGAFSRASSISVRTLRSYHDMGLLVPVRIDRQSGYRYYAVDQLADALVIVRLRELDVPLASVKRILAARDPDLTRQVLAQHRARMEERLAATERIVATLQSGLATATTPVHLRSDPALHIARVVDDVPSSGLWDWLQRSHRFLADVASHHTSVTGPPGALYPAEIDDEDIEHVEAFVPIAEPFLVPASAVGVTISQIPATTWAVLVHPDVFDTIGDTYRLLGAWVGRNAVPTGQPVCERYLESAAGASGPAVYTEIRWPIEPSG